MPHADQPGNGGTRRRKRMSPAAEAAARPQPSRADSIASRAEFGISRPGFVGTPSQRDSLRLSMFRARKGRGPREEPRKRKDIRQRLIDALRGTP